LHIEQAARNARYTVESRLRSGIQHLQGMERLQALTFVMRDFRDLHDFLFKWVFAWTRRKFKRNHIFWIIE
jgi:hypothetical protein